MRLVCVLLTGVILAGCAVDQTERNAPTTLVTVTTTPPGPATSTSTRPTTSMTRLKGDDGSESIGVTDKVTIVVTDREDG